MAYLLLAFILFVIYFICSWAVVFFFSPKVPRNYFLLFLLVFAAVYLFLTLPFSSEMTEVQLAAWFSGLVSYVLVCFTMWNTFYSVLWGFSGGLLADFVSQNELRSVERIVAHYRGPMDPNDVKAMDRMLKRRVPGLLGGQYVEGTETGFRSLGKGKFLALITLFLYWFFALGRGGGIVEEGS